MHGQQNIKKVLVPFASSLTHCLRNFYARSILLLDSMDTSIFAGVKQQGHGVDHCLPYSIPVLERAKLCLSAPYVITAQTRDNFTFLLSVLSDTSLLFCPVFYVTAAMSDRNEVDTVVQIEWGTVFVCTQQCLFRDLQTNRNASRRAAQFMS